jgi:hypothetical protein
MGLKETWQFPFSCEDDKPGFVRIYRQAELAAPFLYGG